MRRRPVSLIVITALVALAACTDEPSSPEPAPKPRAARSNNGFFIQMPAKAAAATVEAYAGVVVNVTSNLPDGTLAYVTSDAPGLGEEIALLHRFVGGALTFRKFPSCPGPMVGGLEHFDRKRGFNLQIVVVPDISLIYKGEKAACRSLMECGTGPFQPPTVQSVLGRNFERLTGSQVTSILGSPALVASAHYDWPEGDCRVPLDVAEGFPVACRPSAASINGDERGQNIEVVINSIPVVLSQNRGCDLYNFTTRGFRRARSWPVFRDRLKRWLMTKGHTPAGQMVGWFVSGGRVPPKGSPRFLDLYYILHGKRVVRATFEATARRPGFTRWEIARLDLL